MWSKLQKIMLLGNEMAKLICGSKKQKLDYLRKM